jgi:hypothetical protein
LLRLRLLHILHPMLPIPRHSWLSFSSLSNRSNNQGCTRSRNITHRTLHTTLPHRHRLNNSSICHLRLRETLSNHSSISHRTRDHRCSLHSSNSNPITMLRP